MKKYGNIVILILSVISTIISIIAICRVCPNTSELGLDYQGIIVGMLALLVTALIGWQIYIAINVKEELKEIKALRKEIDGKINAMRKEMEANFAKELGSVSSILMSLSSDKRIELIKNLFGVLYLNRNNNSFALSFSAKMIHAYLEGLVVSDKSTVDKALEEMVNSLTYEEVSTYIQKMDACLDGDLKLNPSYTRIRKLLLSVLQEIC